MPLPSLVPEPLTAWNNGYDDYDDDDDDDDDDDG